MSHHAPSVPPRSHTAGAGQGPVAVEVGVATGAVVLWTSSAMDGVELEISPDVDGAPRHHVAVLPRQLPGGVRHAAVFPGLPAGRYRVWRPSGRAWQLVDVPESVVSEVSWDG